MFTVFISYRHQDSTAGWATAIQVHLKAVCGLDAFKDVDSLPPGVDWRKHIREALQDCDVALVLIGSMWLNATDEQADRRLDDPNDVLRFEIAEVLSRENVRVIPVLFDSVRMPEAERLPPEIRALADKQAYRWHSDQPSASHLQSIEAAVVLGLHGRSGPTASEPGLDGALSAQVLRLCGALLDEISDEVARREVKRIQRALRGPIRNRRGERVALGDAERADKALKSLEQLSSRLPDLRFLRDRVEELRDSGPDMQMIEVAKWYERCLDGELDLPQNKLDEIERLLIGRSPAERLGLDRSAADRELRAAVVGRVHAWTTFENSSLASPNAQRLARAVEAFYERLSERLEAQAPLVGKIVDA